MSGRHVAEICSATVFGSRRLILSYELGVRSVRACRRSATVILKAMAEKAPISPALARFLAALEAQGQTETAWAGGTVPLRLTSYCCQELPPAEHVSSVRCIVFRGESVLVVRGANQAHVLPGGRREPGETLDQTLARELLEETGWTVGPTRLIGVVHLHHLGPRPTHVAPTSPHYPDFLWLIYVAEAAAERPGAIVPDYPEGVPGFVPLSDVALLPLDAESRLFLARACVIWNQDQSVRHPKLEM